MPAALMGQLAFPEAVDRAFGSDQALVNGVQFSNQYFRHEGHPYFMEGRFREGSVRVNEQWYEQVRIRYNLYSQRVELEYLTPEGHMNQLMTVAEQVSAFILEGYEFRHMKIGEEAPGYYQVLSSGSMTFYIGWRRELLGSESSQGRFGPQLRKYWIKHGEQWIAFHNRNTYVQAFPPYRKKEFKKLLREKRYSFTHATIPKMVELIEATIDLYETEERP